MTGTPKAVTNENATRVGRDRPAIKTLPAASNTEIEFLPGVGPTRTAELRRLGVANLRQLLEYFPRDYQLEAEERPIDRLVEGAIGIARGEIVAVNYIAGRGKPRLEATLADDLERLALVFFNGAYLRSKIHPGMFLRVRGPVRNFRGLPQMVNPKWEIVEPDAPSIGEPKLRAVYPASERLSSETIEKIIEKNMPAGVQRLGEWHAKELLSRRSLLGRAQAYQAIHQPENYSQALRARRRIVYDELISMQLALLMSRNLAAQALSAPILRVDRNVDRRILARFPFELTTAQQHAVWQIVADLKTGRPMKRLLQGDVGSGKTVVALYGMLVAVANKMQAAILAPTEVLAEQHFLTIGDLLRESKVRIELFTSRTRQKSKGKLAAALAAGEIDLAVGTQALLQEKIEFANLGLIVVDEQHRLGVRQRAYLTGKSRSPHYLVMTATPIPRTLALSYFADFDLTTIDQLPPNRRPIRTQWLGSGQSGDAYAFLKKEVSAGRQAYIVVPQIDGDESGESRSVAQLLKKLSTGPLAGLRLAGLHGQMSTEEKQRIMTDFRAGGIDALVATTMIEVGIDVPNATVILVEGAERFGLSQLHQLRGRVGRGSENSYCILLSDAVTPDAKMRLQTLASTSSGFEIAEMDLRLRGPGEFFGIRQHGLPQFKLADLENETEMLLAAKEDATCILAADPHLRSADHAALRAMLIEQFGESLSLAQVG